MNSICIMVQMFFIVDNIPFCSVRVSNELGAGNVEAACFSVYFNGYIFNHQHNLCNTFSFLQKCLGYLFTSSPSVVERVSELVPFFTASILLNGIQIVLSGKYLTYPLLMNLFILINYVFPG